jgi:2-oxoglutarate dehydrogenase E1 component
MSDIGPNLGYVDELYAKYLEDPNSVSEAWREFFADYRPAPERMLRAAPVTQAPAAATTRTLETAGKPEAPADVEVPDEPVSEPLRGVAGKIAENMAASLEVPTATSTREVPVKLLEENRRLINQHQATTGGGKISFTHLIAWAIVRTLEVHPGMNAGFDEKEGLPHRLRRERINLGLAIDIEKRGERVLLVPNIKDVGSLDFPSLVAAYDDLVQRARQGKLTLEDYEGTTVTLTNPGMLGTSMSVPRLMVGQGTIFGVGAIGYPAEYKGMAPETITELGLSKTMTVTSTYDHRVIQGAESGLFLARLEQLLIGEHGFYQRIYGDLNVPHEPVAWSGDQNPQLFGAAGNTEAIEKQARVMQLIRSYRVRGHLVADINPLGRAHETHPELELSTYGLTLWDLDRHFITGGLAGHPGTLTLREILEVVRGTYTRHVGVEFMHMQEPEVRGWLQERMEATRNAEPLDREDQQRILGTLNAAEAFEKFLHSTYVGHKRFSLEGAEAVIPMLDALLNKAADAGVDSCVIGMAHRGRLNVLANTVGKSHEQIFREFEGDIDPTSMHGSGDVKYHLGATGEHAAPDGKKVAVSVASNPSHLEAVDPVVEGMVRAIQDRTGDTARERSLPVLIHGDAAVSGQGVVAETLNCSQLKGYRTGGTIHIVINNQIGFTTGPTEARSSRYATDVAKMVQAPIFHVNGDHPEAVVRVIRLAFDFRQAFKRDVVVDLLSYRRWGHNEADDPSYTHPLLYAKINDHRSVRKLYTERLLRCGDLDPDAAEKTLEDFRRRLEAAFESAREIEEKTPPPPPDADARDLAPDETVATTVDRELLDRVMAGIGRTPDGFDPHPKLARQLDRRYRRFEQDKIDWALGEALAFGTLVLEGTPVRLSGEDSGRGTFSQRHVVLYDHEAGLPFVPLALLAEEQAPFMIYDSHLSEFAVLGFEYGFSVEYPEALVIWEAQFGDFANGAATRDRAPSTRAPDSSGFCNWPRAATSRSPTPARPASTSTCCADR